MASIKCGKCGLTHTSVEEVRSCYAVQSQSRTLLDDGTFPLFDDPKPSNVETVFVPIQTDQEIAKESTRNQFGQTKPGFYKVGDDIFRVTPARTSNRTFAYLLLRKMNGEPYWEYAGLAVKYVPQFGERLTLQEAREFGHSHGYCLVCGRLLTNPASVEAGIGPSCARRLA